MFHALLRLHGLLLLLRERLARINTGRCRASLFERKLSLIDNRFPSVGYYNFGVRRELL